MHSTWRGHPDLAKKFVNSSQFMFIKTWEEYSRHSCDKNTIYKQFDNLTRNNYVDIWNAKSNQCIHNKYENHELFIHLLCKYANNDKKGNNINKKINSFILNENDGHGICSMCSQKFIIKTNGLYQIFVNWKNNTMDSTKLFKLYRYEFNNTNITFTKIHYF